MFKSDGTILARYDYDPWGRTNEIINTRKPHYNFTGLYRHPRSDLLFATYRAYDPALGRWLSRDPIGEPIVMAGLNGGQRRMVALPSASSSAEILQGPNLYAYVSNNPIRKVDPLGLSPSSGFNRGIEAWQKGLCRLCSLGGGHAQYVAGACTACQRNCQLWCVQGGLDNAWNTTQLELCNADCAVRAIQCVRSGCSLSF